MHALRIYSEPDAVLSPNDPKVNKLEALPGKEPTVWWKIVSPLTSSWQPTLRPPLQLTYVRLLRNAGAGECEANRNFVPLLDSGERLSPWALKLRAQISYEGIFSENQQAGCMYVFGGFTTAFRNPGWNQSYLRRPSFHGLWRLPQARLPG